MATRKFFQCKRPSCMAMPAQGRFMSEQPICPVCNLEANHPKFGHMICRLALVHFDPPSEFPGIGMNWRACDPTKFIGAPTGPDGIPNPWHAGTGDPTKVTCEDCRKTRACQEALALAGDEDNNATAAALNRLQGV